MMNVFTAHLVNLWMAMLDVVESQRVRWYMHCSIVPIIIPCLLLFLKKLTINLNLYILIFWMSSQLTKLNKKPSVFQWGLKLSNDYKINIFAALIQCISSCCSTYIGGLGTMCIMKYLLLNFLFTFSVVFISPITEVLPWWSRLYSDI